MTDDDVFKTLAWLALAAHVAVGVIALRRPGGSPLLPLLNLVVGLGVLAYWATQWYAYVARGVTWSATDQLVPLYALVACVLAALALAGRLHASALQWVVFTVDAVVTLGAVAFAMFFKMKMF